MIRPGQFVRLYGPVAAGRIFRAPGLIALIQPLREAVHEICFGSLEPWAARKWKADQS